jgi:hypothetical protein
MQSQNDCRNSAPSPALNARGAAPSNGGERRHCDRPETQQACAPDRLLRRRSRTLLVKRHVDHQYGVFHHHAGDENQRDEADDREFRLCRKFFSRVGWSYDRWAWGRRNSPMIDFKGSHFERDVILWGVR